MSYDTMGRVLTEQRTINGSPNVTKTISYSYNLDGSVATMTYPSGRVIANTFNAAQQLVSATDSSNNYATSAVYALHGGLTSALFGWVSGGFAGESYSVNYDNRLRPGTIAATSSGWGTVLQTTASYLPNGNVSTYTNNLVAGRTQSFTYDALNRVSTAASQATSGTYCWGQGFVYDRYGNLTTINSTQSGSQCGAPGLSLSVNANNQITTAGYSYDVAGNQATDASNAPSLTYVWDAEGRMVSASNGTTTTYTYDGDGARVKKSSGTLYWRALGGPVLAETDTSGTTTNEYIYFGGRMIARRDSSGNVLYYYGNHLGTNQTITTAGGQLCYDADFYPFGGEKNYTNTCAQNYKFTGDERDPETGNDHTQFRQYESTLGRWLSPDPLAGDISNPQSLNRYAYVLNNPTSLIDPLGLDGVNCGSDLQNCTMQVTSSAAAAASDDGPGSVFWDLVFGSGGPGGSFALLLDMGAGRAGGRPGNGNAPPDINHTWWGTYPCGQSATQLMSNVQNDMGRFANNRSLPWASDFPSTPLKLGQQYDIFPGLTTEGGGIAPVGDLRVTVTAQTPNAWVFTTDPTHHYFNGTVAFIATDAGNGNVTFSITAVANYSNRVYQAIGPALKAAENSTWNNLLNNLQGYCSWGGG